MKKIILGTIKLYQYVFSFLPHRCRFSPTCSHYAGEAIEKHGIIAGLWLAVGRILRCHPFCKGGLDSVPERIRFLS